ncbi:MAG: sulfatase-like hydrolase/transferase [Planctomycetes bacterium]|nr:sulfatase-like hydrolase/transferase [Planctomycetota bacterium]
MPDKCAAIEALNTTSPPFCQSIATIRPPRLIGLMFIIQKPADDYVRRDHDMFPTSRRITSSFERPYPFFPRLLAMAGVLMLLAAMPAHAVEPTPRPNIVIILADDLGYGDPHCNNPESKIPTPNIDKFAASGLRFTDGHSSSGVCSPSRYTLLTGRYHWRTRLTRGIVGLWENPLIAPDRMTLASMLKANGYTTGAIGKWHLGWDWPIEKGERSAFRQAAHNANPTDKDREIWKAVFSRAIAGGPTTRGFDTYFGTDVPNWPPYCFIENDHTLGIPSDFLPPRQFEGHLASQQGPALKDWDFDAILPTLADRAEKFIVNNAKARKPFFLYLPLTAPHTPLAVTPEWRGKSGMIPYSDFVMETDAIIGRVLAAIDASGEADQTLVILTSDNGCAPYIGVDRMEKMGHHASGPLRGYKGDAWEGGHRVPFIIRYPGVTKPGTVTHQLAEHADFMATFAEIVGYKLPPTAGEDSVSLLPILRGEDHPVRDSAISQGLNGLFAIRKGDFKLILGKGSGGWSNGVAKQPGQLYHITDDIGETKNIYDTQPSIVTELKTLLAHQVESGRSTPGPDQPNDRNISWDNTHDPDTAPTKSNEPED